MEKRNTNKNWIPVWFKLYKELNQPTHIHILKINRFTDKHHYTTFDHSKTDGFGIALDIFRKDGWNIQLPQKALIKVPLVMRLFSIIRYPYWARARHVKWLNYDKKKNEEIGPFFHRFGPDKTQKILGWCQDNDTNLNSFLLWTANQVCNELLVHPSNSNAIWWIPVDVRSFIEATEDMNNLTSHIAVEIGAKDSAQIVRRKTRKFLKRLDFIGAWWWLQIGNYIGEGGMRKILKRQISINRWTGSLTNMGKWPINGMTPPPNYPYAVVGNPPATIGHPIALGTILFKDELYICGTLNNCILKERDDAQIYFNKWTKLIQETSAGTSLPLP